MKANYRTLMMIYCISTIFALILACSLKPSPQKVVGDYFNTFNTHQVSAIMVKFTDDFTFEVPKSGINVSGKEQLRAILEYDSVLNTVLTPSNLAVKGDTVYCSLTEHNDWIAAAEIPDLFYPGVMVVLKETRISRILAEVADSSHENMEQVLDYFVPWGNEKYPDKMLQMAPHGDFVANAENGATIIAMLREWKAEQMQGQQQ